MRAVAQRVSEASVTVENSTVSQIRHGLLVLIGIAKGDGPKDVETIANKLASLRVFEDEAGKMNCSILDTHGEILLVSQFTLMGDVRKGNRPSFDSAEHPDLALPLFEELRDALFVRGISVKTGIFRAHMQVASTNDGPVTILIDSKKLF